MSISNPKKVDKPDVIFPVTDMSPKDIELKLVKARIEMLMSLPFFGTLATRLILVDATDWPDGLCPTAATDGKYLYYNRNFIASLGFGETIFLVAHEVMHCVYDHMDTSRRGDRIPLLWNIANDYVINYDLVKGRVGEKITKVDICYNEDYADMTSEEIYDIIYEKAKKNGGCTGGQTILDTHLDRHPGDDKGSRQGDGGGDLSKGPANFTDEQKKEVAANFRSGVIQAAQSCGAGNMPGNLKRFLDKLLNPQIDWRELLELEIKSLIKSDYDFRTFSKKGWDQGIYLPGMDTDDMVDVCIAIDTSGSISNTMLQDFLSEIKGIMDQYETFKLKIWCFDTEVHNMQSFSSEGEDDITTYELAGFGGTDFTVNWDHMKENDIEPKKFIMFTDGYPFSSWGDEGYCETLFIVHGKKDGSSPVAPFGVTVPYSSKKN